MNPREDMKAALECRQPAGSVPLWELQFHLWDELSGEHVILGPEFAQLSGPEQEKALRTNAEIILQVSREVGFAAVRAPTDYWEEAPGRLAYYVLPERAHWEQIRLLREMAPSDLMIVGSSSGIISPPSGAGYEQFAYLLFDDPDQVEEMAEKALAESLDTGRRLRDLGAEVVVCAADIADNHGPYFTPPQMDRFVLPYLAKWGEAMREFGLYSILHTDGQVTPILDAIANTGISAIQALDPIAGVDIIEAKQLVGSRLCLCGNIDCGLLHLGPPERIYEVTRDVIQACKPGGGFVLGASNAVFRETPPDHYRTMLQAWREYGSYT